MSSPTTTQAPTKLSRASRLQRSRSANQAGSGNQGGPTNVGISTLTPAADGSGREKIVLDHLHAASSVAYRYRERGEDLQDLIQVARLGLVEASRRYDPQQGDFLSFAVPTMTGMLKKHFRDHGWMIRPPRRIQELQKQVEQTRSALLQTLNRAPTQAEIAGRMGVDPEQVKQAEAARSCFHPLSLDGPSPSGRYPFDSLSELPLGFEAAEARAVISQACRDLSPQDRQMILLRFYEEQTQQEIATAMGMTQMQVSRSLARILTTLREVLGQRDAVPEEETSS